MRSNEPRHYPDLEHLNERSVVNEQPTFDRDEYIRVCEKKARMDAELLFEICVQRIPVEQASAAIPHDTWMTTREAAKYMNISERTVGSWAKSGKLEAHRNGRLLRFKKAACDRAMKG